MTWLKIDDRFAEHPKVIGLSAQAFRLHVAALCRCAAHLTDGRVTERDVRVLTPVCGLTTWKRYVNECVSAGLWTVEAHGWSINDYLDYNPSSVKVREQRERHARNQSRYRSRERSSDRSSARVPYPYPIDKEQPEAFVPRDVASEVRAGTIVNLHSVLKDVS